MVLSDKCKECGDECHAIHFQRNLQNWTSGDGNIDEFIQRTQLLSHGYLERVLEWIPYDKFYNINYIAEMRYKANWVDGYMINWDNKTQNWERECQNMNVELKRFKSSSSMSVLLEFLKEV
jgi:hypothetical protein